MKILIVDDENHVIKAIRLLVPWDTLGITEIFEASNAEDAISLIEKETPELLITDVVMDDLTGIDIMKYINNSGLSIKIIVISGYNDFNYVRGSLQNGGIDYLLKPLDQKQLITALEKAIATSKKESNQKKEAELHQYKLSSMTELCQEAFFLKMYQNYNVEATYHELVNIFPEFKEVRQYCTAYSSLTHYKQRREGSLTVKNKELFCMLEEKIKLFPLWTLVSMGSSLEEFVLFIPHEDNIEKRLEAILQDINPKGFHLLHFGLSNAKNFPAEMTDSLTEARQSFFQLPVFLEFTPLVIPPQCQMQALPFRNDEIENLLLSALLTGNEHHIYDAITEWMDLYFYHKNISLGFLLEVIELENNLLDEWSELLKKRYEGFLHQKTYYYMSYSSIIDTQYRVSSELFLNKMKMDIFFLFHELRRNLSPESDTMYQIAHYIEINYHKPFSQFACAQLFFMNKEHMCRKFKQNFNVSMINYLNQIRIDHAKELMLDPNMKIRQIAHNVGFEDEKYFSRQFKKITNMTPNEYRNKLL